VSTPPAHQAQLPPPAAPAPQIDFSNDTTDPKINLNTTLDNDGSYMKAANKLNRKSIADFANYNTMPRGWGRSSVGYYKPVKAEELNRFIRDLQ
jgi:hypothetical protein